MAQIEKNNSWEESTERFVAFFDIMGFKDLVSTNTHDDVMLLLKGLHSKIKSLEKTNNYVVEKTNRKFGETKSFTFSDSIIFFTKKNNVEDVNKILLDCLYVIKVALQLKIPIKGAISYGKITIDIENSIYFGKPIINAYLLHDELNLFSVIADHSFELRIKELNLKTLSNFELYKTPLKSGKAKHYILKPVSVDKESTLVNLEKLYLTVSGKPRQYIDNTIEFINSVSYTTDTEE